jgi:hypothetical protein
MAELIFVKQSQSTDSEFSQDGRSLEERLRAIEQMNPRIDGHEATGDLVPMLLAESETDEKMCKADFDAFKKQYARLEPMTKKGMDEIGASETLVLLEAIEQFKQENFPNYGAYEATADTNTFGGGALAVMGGRADTIIQQMRQIEVLLAQYASAPALDKGKLKSAIQAAYKNLHLKFGPILEKYVARAKAGHKVPALYSPRRAIKMASNGRLAPLTKGAKSSRLLTAARGLRWVTRGLVVLDAGIRMNNVYQSENRTRTLFAETLGWGASAGSALLGSSIAVSLALGPVGWIVVILLIGAVAVGADYFGKYLANSVYDYFVPQSNNYTLSYTQP